MLAMADDAIYMKIIIRLNEFDRNACDNTPVIIIRLLGMNSLVISLENDNEKYKIA